MENSSIIKLAESIHDQIRHHQKEIARLQAAFTDVNDLSVKLFRQPIRDLMGQGRLPLTTTQEHTNMSIIDMVTVVCREIYDQTGKTIFSQEEVREAIKARWNRDIKPTSLQPIIARRRDLFPKEDSIRGGFRLAELEKTERSE